jgi:membrane-associated protein
LVPSAHEHHHFAFGLGTAGPILVWVIVLSFVFVECAFILGLFLPGDSLLFTAGLVLADRDNLASAIGLAVAAVVVATVGNQLGYYISRKASTKLFGRRGARIITQERLDRAGEFLDRHGWWSVVLARWIPWVRTLAPIVAGATRMNPRKYLLGTAIGAVIWVPVLVIGGYYGAGILDTMPWLKATVTSSAIAFFVVGTGYGAWRYRGEMRRLREKEAGEAADPEPAPVVSRPAPSIKSGAAVKTQG